MNNFSSDLKLDYLFSKRLNKTTIGLSLAGVATLVLSGIFMKRRVQAQEKIPRESQLGLIAINKKPPGLVNFGNTCFVNSVLQALASMPKFIKNLEELCLYDDFKELKLKNQCKKSIQASKVKKNKEAQIGIGEYSTMICKELLSILHVLNDDQMGNDEYSYQPTDLISLLEDSSDYLSFREQQDSHEVLKLLINCFEDTLKKGNYNKSDLVNISKKEQVLSNSLLGYINTYLQCTTCDKKFNNRIEAFYDLSLDIINRSIYSLEDSISNYFQCEYIDGKFNQDLSQVQSYFQLNKKGVECLNCSVNSFLRVKQVAVQKLTNLFATNNDINVLTAIELLKKQIEFVEQRKNRSMVETDELKAEIENLIKEQLNGSNNLSKYLGNSFFPIMKTRIKKVQTIAKTPQILILHLKRLIINPSTGDPCKVDKFIEFNEELQLDKILGLKKQENIHQFQLSSLISHIGTDNFGHYVTLRRIWHQKYSPCYSEQINAKQYTKSLWYLTSDKEIRYIKKEDVFHARAYILFYEKMES